MPAPLAPARAAAPLLAVVAFAAGPAPAAAQEAAQEATLTGFTAARAVTQLACEARFLDLPRSGSFREHLRTVTENPHPAGSEAQVRVGNYLARRGRFTVSEGGAAVATLSPEKRIYLPQRTPTTEAAIRTTWFADLYIVLGDPHGEGGHAVRLYHNPLVPWIWIGAVLMFLGGMISLTDRRHRVGAPRRSVRPAPPQPAEA